MSKSHANDSSVDENEFYLSNLYEQYKRSVLEGTSTPNLHNGHVSTTADSPYTGSCLNRELKIKTFSGRRRPGWQSKAGTEAAVNSRQNSNIIKIAVNSEGRRLRRLPKRKICFT